VPAAVGSGDSTEVVMQWDMVPRQGVTATDRRICVYAYHKPNSTEYGAGTKNAMAKVRFIADNGTPTDVTSTTLSNRTNGTVPEYCVDLDLSSYSNNEYTEIRAIGYPTNGQPVVLQGSDNNIETAVYQSATAKGRFSLFLVAKYAPTRYWVGGVGASDSNSCTDSAHPCATIPGARSKIGSNWQNQEVCLQEGSWNLNPTTGPLAWVNVSNGWWTIAGCPGTAKSNVKITSWGYGGKSNTQRIHFKNLTITGPKLVNSDNATTTNNAYWFDNVDWIGPASCVNIGPDCDYPVSANGGAIRGGTYWTDSKVSNMFNAQNKVALGRNYTVDRINADAFQNAFVILNATVRNVTYCCGAHPDFNQMTNLPAVYNHIMAYITATDHVTQQGIFQSCTSAGVGCTPITNAIYTHIAFNGGAQSNVYNALNLSYGADNVSITDSSLADKGGARLTSGAFTNSYFADNVCSLLAGGIGTPSGWTIRNSASCQ
jgi:hypothetical protein